MANSTSDAKPKARRGRPPGSKNKPKAGKAASKGASMMDALLAFMRSNPKAMYADAKAAVERAGHTLYPISWGRAQLLLGRVRAKGGRAAKAAVKVARNAAAEVIGAVGAVKRGPGRPRKNVAASQPMRMTSSGGATSFPVTATDLPRMQAFVDALNGGAKAEIRYGRNGWQVVTG